MRTRWLPGLWFAEPGRKVSAQPVQRIEWQGNVRVPADGIYRLQLETKARTTVWVDDQPVLLNSNSMQQWEARLAAGWHRLRVASEEPQWRDLRFCWLGPGDQLEVVGGITSRPLP